ncbi:TetR/AcrR family transcriptional regulator [Croceitalea rosinachiae]|uniref:TetR/AcrR family transcriptional regulator n=1 Tax=Croceitalea rosinachiae TaxID=3075596 RepID=A0ABU3A982_9FLAO|nr:TetR/AcrR family transcriptional regulator [Croceitalea sp. F388]MDT0606453.1 TetR/AcrR family transcriptional regulator [Croceitalea sp. F388]
MQRTNIKEHIITIASKLFYMNGYNATGINEIIAKAEIAKATLYHHFKSKEDICIAYLEERHAVFMDDLKEYIAKKNDGRQKLIAIFDFLRDLYRKGDFHGCWGIKTLGELPPENQKIVAVIQRQKKELLLFLGEIVGDTIANISRAETEKISGGLYLLYEGAITESHLHRNDWPIHLAKSIAPSIFAESKLN